MFGITETPAPGFSTTVSQNAAIDSLEIIACRPTDTAGVPESILAKWQPLEGSDIWGVGNCESCNCSVLLSVDQGLLYAARRDTTLVLCLVHTAMTKIQLDVDTTQLVIHRAGA